MKQIKAFNLRVDVFYFQLYIGVALSQDVDAPVEKLTLLAVFGLARIGEQVSQILAAK
jgi:hypothetical protein